MVVSVTARWRALAVAVLVVGYVPSAEAQEADQVVDVQARGEASVAYERATSLYAAGDFSRAGRFFMTAYRLAPARAALVQAVRAYSRAEDVERAGNLGLSLSALYGENEDAASEADAAIARAAQDFFRVDVECEGCEVSVGPTVYPATSLFLAPDVEHALTAHFGERGRVERSVQGAASEQQTVSIETPAAPDPDDLGDDSSLEDTTRAIDDDGRNGMHPAVALTFAAATVAVGAVTLWSGLDTLAGVDDFEAMPTQEAYDEGQRKELRTNALIGVSAGLAVTTILMLVFTDYGGDDDIEVGASASTAGGMLTVGGTL